MEAINKSVQDKEKRNSKTSCSELEVHNPRFYIITFVMDWYELGKRIGFYKGVRLEGVDDDSQDRQHVDDAYHGEYDRQDPFSASFRGNRIFRHYCCTSLLRV